ncbi:unnamed protein product, partial [Meganyctiphanes norvegica]
KVGQCVVMSWSHKDGKAQLFTEDCKSTKCYICQTDPIKVEDIPRGKHLDDIDTADLWKHILNQFELPFKDRKTPRGTERYIYILDNEKIPEGKNNPIILPALPKIFDELGSIVNIRRGRQNMLVHFDDHTIIARQDLSKLFS